ncbi:YolD-like protein [Niallia circulans]|uniref:YolD-like family protein n=1 Tax=Niallia circulans TaxID=1397 RepID=UPI00077C4A88|nr:YolD-like family protein [Niallia circulans]MDR4318377.1 YolD-like family protein [Niallia circulans]MED3841104.1 YolD-like family protein [Niallia circulans]MED4242350.1 YolD-like family protein [Niallia circulans]MED4250452.1 YolD-like family protein [Niallia circulans]QKH59853.1 YolD-like family protein [Niallia circulans]
MLKDRGTKKWVAMMLPEHVAGVKKVIESQNKIEQPVLNEDKLNDIDILIHEGMEYNQLLKFSLFNKGYIDTLIGRTVYIDYLNNQLRIQDEKDYIHYVSFRKLVDVEKE